MSRRSTRPPADRPTIAGRALRALLLLSLVWGLGLGALPVSGALAATAAVPPAPVTTGLPRFEAGPCVYTLGKGQVEGQSVVCGTVVAAAKHANPGGATVRLPVAIYKALAATPAKELNVLLAGGPGQSDQVFATLLTTASAFYKGAAANNDTVIFDQRGTGKSQPALQCPEVSGTTSQGFYLQAFADSPFVTAMNRCRDRLTTAGVDLSAYTTTENAADVNDIRLALGYPAMNVIGGSYGTELGLAVARGFGQFVRTNNLSSIVPPQLAWFYEPPQSFNRALNELFTACAANAACAAANPDLKAAFQTVVARLDAHPAILTITDPASGETAKAPLDGATFTGLLFQLTYSTSLVPFLPDMITRTARGDYVWLQNLLPLILNEGNDPTALGMHFSVVCSKDTSAARLNAALEADKGILPEVREALEPSLREYSAICASWPSKGADPKADQPVKSDRPTALVSGQFDPITPPRYADVVKETLTNAVSVTLPGGGHTAIIPGEPVGNCGFTILVTNITNPGKPDTSCVATLKTTYRQLPASIAGGPTPSATPTPAPSPSPSASPTAVPSPSPTPRPSQTPTPAPSQSPAPTPPATGNGGFLPGLPNTGGGGGLNAADNVLPAFQPAPAPAQRLPAWLLLLPLLALGLVALPLVRRLRRRA
jgi:pimeloyl-ACP methyl ester carboxylesterase